MVIGNMHKKLGKDCVCCSRDILADRRTHQAYYTYCSVNIILNVYTQHCFY